MAAENLFLRHQLNIALRQAPPRLRLRGSDRALLIGMTKLWPSLLSVTQVVQPETILRWHRKGFGLGGAPTLLIFNDCVPKTLSVLIGAGNHLTSAHNDGAAVFCGFEMAEIDLILEEAREAKGTASGPDADSRQKLTLNRF